MEIPACFKIVKIILREKSFVCMAMVVLFLVMRFVSQIWLPFCRTMRNPALSRIASNLFGVSMGTILMPQQVRAFSARDQLAHLDSAKRIGEEDAFLHVALPLLLCIRRKAQWLPAPFFLRVRYFSPRLPRREVRGQ